MARTTYRTTHICGYDTESINVRGHDLVRELIGRVGFAGMMQLQLTGRMPTDAQARILDAVMVTIMEHGMVPSAIVTRLTFDAAPESIQGAIVAGLLGVGDRFAGTASECAALLESIAARPAAERAQAALEIVREHRARKAPIPGFGHAIHTAGDPRVPALLAVTADAGGSGEYLAALAHLEQALAAELGRKLVTNVSAAIAAALGEAGVPARAARGIVLTARCAGLAGHLYEEMQKPAAPALADAASHAISYEPQPRR